MIQKIRSQNISYSAFTLIELVIVLIIIWIMLMATVYMSGEQIQKVKDKTVKESILAEMQSRYSRNLWSSSYAWKIYDTMHLNLVNGGNSFNFKYTYWDTLNQENTFTDNFEIKYIAMDYNFTPTLPWSEDELNIEYNPYKISCKIWDDNDSATIIARVNDKRDYCFDINKNNCRMVEVSEEKCKNMVEFIQ